MKLDGKIFHVSREPFMWQDEDGAVIVRLDADKGVLKSAEVLYGAKAVLDSGKKPRRTRMIPYLNNSYRDTFVGRIAQEDPRVVYCFSLQLEDGSRYLFTSQGVIEETSGSWDSQTRGDCFFQYCYTFETERIRVPSIARQPGVVYQIFPDRFAIGDPDKPCMKDADLKVGDQVGRRSFYGGDLKGVQEKIPYLKEIGVGTIYLCPVFKSSSNHRYDVEDYTTVDERLGGDAAMLSLVKAAHASGMKVVMDAVFNHSSFLHPMFQDVLERGKDSPFYRFYMIDGDKPDMDKVNYRTFGLAPYMPKLDTSNPEVIAFCCDALRKVTMKFHIDGWRFDVADEISHDFWFAMHRTVKSLGKDIALITEDWLPSDNFIDAHQFDGGMNYQLRKIILDTVATDKPLAARTCADRLVDLLLRYTWPNDLSMFNLVSSHDVPRLLTMTGESRDKTLLGTAIAVMFPGMFMAYYGDELAMPGGPDPDNRRPVNWDEDTWDRDYLSSYTELIGVKKLEPAISGRVEIRAESNLLFIERYTAKETLTLICNLSDRNGFYTMSRAEKTIAQNQVSGRKLAPWGYLITAKETKRKL